VLHGLTADLILLKLR